MYGRWRPVAKSHIGIVFTVCETDGYRVWILVEHTDKDTPHGHGGGAVAESHSGSMFALCETNGNYYRVSLY